MARINQWEEYARKYGLNTEDLKEILSNLENLEANVGYVPEYFQRMSPEDLMDSTKWGDSSSQMVKNPNAPAGILASQKIMENPDYGLIPANQAYTASQEVKNTLSEGEYLDWVEETFPKLWGDEERRKNYFKRRFPDPNNPYQRGTDPSDPFYTERSFSPHPSSQVVQSIIPGSPVLQYLAAQGNPELDLDNPSQKFFPKKGYPETSLQFLRDYIASGEGITEKVPKNAAGVHWGYDPLAGMFDPTDERKKSWYDIGIDPKYYDQPDALASIAGHEMGHGAVTAYHNLSLDAPYPFAYLKEGKEYDMYKDIYPEMVGAPSKHFADEARFHPAYHSIDEMFFGGYGQPKTSMDRVNPVRKDQAANAMYIINRTMQDERNAALGDWAQSQESEEFFTPSTGGPAGMGRTFNLPSERTSFGLKGPAGMNRGGIASLR